MELDTKTVGAVVSAARRTGWKTGTTKLHDQVWHTERYLGLRCDLRGELRTPPAAKEPIAMLPHPPEGPAFSGFRDEAGRVQGSDALQVLIRRRWCEQGLEGLHVAVAPGGEPAYAQWLLDAEHANLSSHYLPLADDECLLEGAYTFIGSRGMGMMADGMGQLLRIAQERGFTTCFTYVAEDNVPSLKGCARVGFVLDHVRLNERRPWRRRSVQAPPDPRAVEAWQAIA